MAKKGGWERTKGGEGSDREGGRQERDGRMAKKGGWERAKGVREGERQGKRRNDGGKQRDRRE